MALLAACASSRLSDKAGRKPSSEGDASLCTDYRNLSFVRLDNNHGNQSYPDYVCADFKEYDDWTGQILSLSPLPLRNINVIATKALPQDAALDYFFYHLDFGFNKSDRSNDPSLKSIFAHELGHGIFQEFLYAKVPELQGWGDLQRKNSEFTRLTLEWIRLLDGQSTCLNSRCQSFGSANGDKLNEGQAIANQINGWKQSKLYSRFMAIAAPYQELAADVVAALATRNPETVREAVKQLLDVDEPCRGFNFESESVFTPDDPHCAFSGVRKELLKSAIAPALRNHTEKEALAGVMKIFADQVHLQLKAAMSANDPWTFDQASAFESLKIAIRSK